MCETKRSLMRRRVMVSNQEIKAGEIRIVGAGSDAPSVCEPILRSLPDWFGLEEPLVAYAKATATMPTWLAEARTTNGFVPGGFITIHKHFENAAEIHCIAVRPEHHRHGLGRRMVEHCENVLRGEGVRFLQVKTLSPS